MTINSLKIKQSIDKINTELSEMTLKIYPVGSIYISINSTNPSSLFGGEWSLFAEGQTLIGIKSGDTDFGTVEKTGGSKTVTLTTSQIPAHTHTFTGTSHTHTLNNHTHTVPAHAHGLNSHTHSVKAHNHSFSATTSTNGNHSHKTDGQANLNGMKRSGFDNSWYKIGQKVAFYYAEEGAPSGSTTGTSESGNHTHTVSGNTGTLAQFNTGAASGNTANSSQLTSGASNANTSGTTATGTNSNTGGGGAHSNLPPYVVCYIWKRVS